MMKEITLDELHGIYFPFPLRRAVKFHIKVTHNENVKRLKNNCVAYIEMYLVPSHEKVHILALVKIPILYYNIHMLMDCETI